VHPESGKSMTFEAPVPDDLAGLIHYVSML
jgi:hypothetical protein